MADDEKVQNMADDEMAIKFSQENPNVIENYVDINNESWIRSKTIDLKEARPSLLPFPTKKIDEMKANLQPTDNFEKSLDNFMRVLKEEKGLSAKKLKDIEVTVQDIKTLVDTCTEDDMKTELDKFEAEVEEIFQIKSITAMWDSE